VSFAVIDWVSYWLADEWGADGWKSLFPLRAIAIQRESENERRKRNVRSYEEHSPS
jgi:hypothetical protein